MHRTRNAFRERHDVTHSLTKRKKRPPGACRPPTWEDLSHRNACVHAERTNTSTPGMEAEKTRKKTHTHKLISLATRLSPASQALPSPPRKRLGHFELVRLTLPFKNRPSLVATGLVNLRAVMMLSQLPLGSARALKTNRSSASSVTWIVNTTSVSGHAYCLPLPTFTSFGPSKKLSARQRCGISSKTCHLHACSKS